MQLADDGEYPLLVGGELDLLRLTTVDDLGDVVRRNGEAVLVGVRGDVVDQLEPDLRPLLHDQGPGHPDLRPLVVDVDHREAHVLRMDWTRGRPEDEAERRCEADHESPHEVLGGAGMVRGWLKQRGGWSGTR